MTDRTKELVEQYSQLSRGKHSLDEITDWAYTTQDTITHILGTIQNLMNEVRWLKMNNDVLLKLTENLEEKTAQLERRNDLDDQDRRYQQSK